MNARSPVFRLVVLYCALLLLLGACFAWFTIRSFEHYTRETMTRSIGARSSEIWDTAKGSLDDPKQLSQLLELRFAPEAQEHFIRISEGGRILYQSDVPAGTDAEALNAGISGPDASRLRFGSLLVNRHAYMAADGRRIVVEFGPIRSLRAGRRT